MSRQSLADRFEVFVATGVVAAHANAGGDGFRQRDVKFLVELSSNWAESTLNLPVVEIRNTQVLRFLDGLVAEGYARRSEAKRETKKRSGTRQNSGSPVGSGNPVYRLTRTGLLDLLGRIVSFPTQVISQHFFFVYFFITAYRERITALVKHEGKQFPLALQLELDVLLDANALLRRELDRVEWELRKISGRIDDAEQTSAFMRRGREEGRDFLTLLREVERRFPYELNSVKPLSELILSVPEEHRLWELEEGNRLRAGLIFSPARRMLEAYQSELQRLTSRGDSLSES